MRWSAALTVACLFPLACGKVLGIEASHREEHEQGGSSGAAGDGVVGGESGRDGAGGTAEGGSGGSGAQGGAGGVTTQGGAAGGSMGGEGNAGGDPSDPGPMLGEPCDALARSCTSANPKLVLACGGDKPGEPLTWHVDRTCDQYKACDASASPPCQPIASECIDSDGTRCDIDGVLHDCSDPFHYVKRYCPFGCEGTRCVPLSGDELIVHTELEGSDGSTWPGSIPVCFVAPVDEELSPWLRDEVEQSLARYVDVEFTGFGECSTGDVPGVAVEFLHDCRERLGSRFSFGYPGDGDQSRVGICASYFDAAGHLEQMTDHEALFRFVVRHQFGHVLGMACSAMLWQEDAMVRGLEESHAAEKVFSADAISSLISQYGRKPAGSLVTPSGRCLTASSDGTIGVDSCSSSGRFGFESGKVRDLSSTSTSDCFEVHAAGEAVTLGDCASASAVSFARARWSTPSLCIAPRDQGAGSELEATSCAPVGDPSQAWQFEIIPSQDTEKLSALIRPSASDLCLAASHTVVLTGDVPALEACEDGKPEQIFSLWPNGKISLGPDPLDASSARCLRHSLPRGTVSFETCSGAPRFWLSGPLETAGGLALAVSSNDASAVLTPSPLGGDEPPAPDQIFDFSF